MIWLLTRVMTSSTTCPPEVGVAGAAGAAFAVCAAASAGRHARTMGTRVSFFIKLMDRHASWAFSGKRAKLVLSILLLRSLDRRRTSSLGNGAVWEKIRIRSSLQRR